MIRSAADDFEVNYLLSSRLMMGSLGLDCELWLICNFRISEKKIIVGMECMINNYTLLVWYGHGIPLESSV